MLAPATVAVLRQHRAVQLRERLALGEACTHTGYVFVDEGGLPYHPGRYLPMFHAAGERAGVPKIRLHDVRHTMATLALPSVGTSARPFGGANTEQARATFCTAGARRSRATERRDCRTRISDIQPTSFGARRAVPRGVVGFEVDPRCQSPLLSSATATTSVSRSGVEVRHRAF